MGVGFSWDAFVDPANIFGGAHEAKIPGNPVQTQLGRTDIAESGYGNLADILASGGATDPKLLNSQITGIRRSTADRTNASMSKFAGRGLGNSGLNLATAAAIGQGGAGQEADLRANEARLQEERKRLDLQSFLQLFVNPSISYSDIAAQLGIANAGYATQKDAANAELAGKVIGGFAGG